jgi:large subunit ribosomal protein L22
MRFHASHRYVRISPRKTRYVIDLIRGKGVNDALHILDCVHRRAGPFIKKVLSSAIANAGQHGETNVNELYVQEARVDGGPMLKRYRPGPMGRAMRIRKRTSHINVTVAKR